MPSGMRVEVEGIVPLARTFRKIGNEDARTFLIAANREAADTVAGAARSEVPTRTGRLAASIRSSGAAKGGAVLAGRAKVPYAGPIHFGWIKHRIRPNPFLFRALDRRRGEVEDIYQQRLDELLAKVQTT